MFLYHDKEHIHVCFKRPSTNCGIHRRGESCDGKLKFARPPLAEGVERATEFEEWAVRKSGYYRQPPLRRDDIRKDIAQLLTNEVYFDSNGKPERREKCNEWKSWWREGNEAASTYAPLVAEERTRFRRSVNSIEFSSRSCEIQTVNFHYNVRSTMRARWEEFEQSSPQLWKSQNGEGATRRTSIICWSEGRLHGDTRSFRLITSFAEDSRLEMERNTSHHFVHLCQII